MDRISWLTFACLVHPSYIRPSSAQAPPLPPVGAEFAGLKSNAACANLFIEDLVPVFRGDSVKVCGDDSTEKCAPGSACLVFTDEGGLVGFCEPIPADCLPFLKPASPGTAASAAKATPAPPGAPAITPPTPAAPTKTTAAATPPPIPTVASTAAPAAATGPQPPSVPAPAGVAIPKVPEAGTDFALTKLCCDWALAGHCETNPNWMKTSCAAACGTIGCSAYSPTSLCVTRLNPGCRGGTPAQYGSPAQPPTAVAAQGAPPASANSAALPPAPLTTTTTTTTTTKPATIITTTTTTTTAPAAFPPSPVATVGPLPPSPVQPAHPAGPAYSRFPRFDYKDFHPNSHPELAGYYYPSAFKPTPPPVHSHDHYTPDHTLHKYNNMLKSLYLKISSLMGTLGTKLRAPPRFHYPAPATRGPYYPAKYYGPSPVHPAPPTPVQSYGPAPPSPVHPAPPTPVQSSSYSGPKWVPAQQHGALPPSPVVIPSGGYGGGAGYGANPAPPAPVPPPVATTAGPAGRTYILLLLSGLPTPAPATVGGTGPGGPPAIPPAQPNVGQPGAPGQVVGQPGGQQPGQTIGQPGGAAAGTGQAPAARVGAPAAAVGLTAAAPGLAVQRTQLAAALKTLLGRIQGRQAGLAQKRPEAPSQQPPKDSLPTPPPRDGRLGQPFLGSLEEEEDYIDEQTSQELLRAIDRSAESAKSSESFEAFEFPDDAIPLYDLDDLPSFEGFSDEVEPDVQPLRPLPPPRRPSLKLSNNNFKEQVLTSLVEKLSRDERHLIRELFARQPPEPRKTKPLNRFWNVESLSKSSESAEAPDSVEGTVQEHEAEQAECTTGPCSWQPWKEWTDAHGMRSRSRACTLGLRCSSSTSVQSERRPVERTVLRFSPVRQPKSRAIPRILPHSLQ